MNIPVRIEYEVDLREYSDSRLRELLEEAEALRERALGEIRTRIVEGHFNMHNLVFLKEDDLARLRP